MTWKLTGVSYNNKKREVIFETTHFNHLLRTAFSDYYFTEDYKISSILVEKNGNAYELDDLNPEGET